MSRTLACDIYGVRETGLETWLQDDGWPIEDKVYFGFLDAALDAFDREVFSLPEKERDPFLADSSFINQLCQLIHAKAAMNFAEQNSIDLAMGSLATPYYQPNWETIASLPRQSGARWPAARRLAKRWQYNGHLNVVRRVSVVTGICDAWNIGSISPLKQAFISTHGLRCDHPYIDNLLDGLQDTKEDLSDTAEQTLGRLIASVAALAKSHLDVRIDESQVTETWRRRLKFVSQICDGFEKRRDVPPVILLGEIAKPVNRAIALGARRQGAKIYGFHHGNGMMETWRKMTKYTNYLVVDCFVCPSQRQVTYHQRNAERYQPPRPVSFESLNIGRYESLRRKAANEEPVSEIRTVMVMGMPMTAIRYAFCLGDFFAHQLRVELRLIEILKQAGYRVLYKMHPEQVKPCGSVFHDRADAVITEPFETCWNQADAFVFGVIATTTFGFSLTTNRFIYALDVEGTDWNAEAYDLLKKRVNFVPARFDDRKRLGFAEDVLLEKLRTPSQPEFGFVDTVMGAADIAEAA